MGNVVKPLKKTVAHGVVRGLAVSNRALYRMQRDNNELIVFNTALETDNLGDQIIMRYCDLAIKDIFGERLRTDISTHRVPSEDQEKKASRTKYKLVCGTNLLTSHIEYNWNWRLPDGIRAKRPYRNVILMGTGWGSYQDECSEYTKLVYQSLLNPVALHAVRDQYTADKLKNAGIKNVINTGCPTMWGLTPGFCREIPTKKAPDVITTITDYRRDPFRDNAMLDILGRNYRNVYLWIQGRRDEEYLNTLNRPEQLILVPRSLAAFEERLCRGEIDYVGTRLHAGIFALNHQIRSLIVAVDNRATEIARDTGLPIISADHVGDELETRITGEFATDIMIHEENIRRFKEQFR